MSGPTRRAASLVARAYLASPTAVTTTAAGTWRSHVVPLAARARESTAFGGFRGFARDSDDDFKPKTHATGDDAIQAAIATDVKENKVLLYMKGTPAAPRCGFSNMAVQILNFHGASFASRDVLSSEELRAGIKTFTSWPTVPQVFIDGEFIGGCDILRQMHDDGSLAKELEKVK